MENTGKHTAQERPRRDGTPGGEGRIEFRRATAADADTVIRLQNLAFYDDFVRYGFCPAYQAPPGQVAASLNGSKAAYLILEDGEPVGDVVAVETSPGECFLSCLCVAPAKQGRGIGGRALEFLDALFPHTRVWTLETPADKTENLRFYEAHGYRIIKQYPDRGVEVVLLQRARNI